MTRPLWLSPLMLRILSGAAVLGVFFGLVLVGLPGVVSLALIVGGLALWEFRGLSDKMGFRAPVWLLYPLGLAFMLYGSFLRRLHWFDLSLVLSVALMGGLMAFLFIPGRRQGLGRWAMGMAGAIYIGMPFNYLLLLFTARAHPSGLAWMVFAILAAVVSDVVALLVGSRFGRTPWFPNISPQKTLEGAVAGVVGAVLTMLLGAFISLDIPVWHAIALGLLIGFAAEAGDLVESQMKRIAEVKDSSNLIPGHGGVLDRIDSILFPPIVVFYYATWLGLIHTASPF